MRRIALLTLVLALSAATVAQAATGYSWSATAPGKHIHMERTGKVVQNIRVTLTWSCTDQSGQVSKAKIIVDLPKKVTLSSTGAFSSDQQIAARDAQGSVSFAGKLGSKKGKGTLKWNLQGASATAQCKSQGSWSWSAKRGKKTTAPISFG
jgi:hypothetical protein